MSTTASGQKQCARCHKRLGDKRIYSRWTRSYYCWDDAACGRRARRKGLAPRKAVTA